MMHVRPACCYSDKALSSGNGFSDVRMLDMLGVTDMNASDEHDCMHAIIQKMHDILHLYKDGRISK